MTIAALAAAQALHGSVAMTGPVQSCARTWPSARRSTQSSYQSLNAGRGFAPRVQFSIPMGIHGYRNMQRFMKAILFHLGQLDLRPHAHAVPL